MLTTTLKRAALCTLLAAGLVAGCDGGGGGGGNIDSGMMTPDTGGAARSISFGVIIGAPQEEVA